MRVVIAGAAGFIGSHLVDRYLEDGHDVIGVDNFLTGSLNNLSSATGNRRFTFLEADVSVDLSPLDNIVRRQGGIDLVLHFASPASPVDYRKYPIATMLANSRGTEFLAELALRYDAAFLYASTSESYGDPLVHPQPEHYWGNVNPVGERSCYDEAKRFGEAFVAELVRSKNLNGRIIRIFNTYGPRMQLHDGRVVPNFILQALTGKPLTIYGDGKQTRSFCYVDDLVDAISRCAQSCDSRGKIINLGNPEEHAIGEFAAIVCRIAQVALKVATGPLPPDDPSRRCPDITRARELLDWEPRVSLDDGLRRTIEYFRTALPGNVAAEA